MALVHTGRHRDQQNSKRIQTEVFTSMIQQFNTGAKNIQGGKEGAENWVCIYKRTQPFPLWPI